MIHVENCMVFLAHLPTVSPKLLNESFSSPTTFSGSFSRVIQGSITVLPCEPPLSVSDGLESTQER